MSLTVLVTPSGFKESRDVEDVACAINAGILQTCPDARVLQVPWSMAAEALAGLTGGKLHPATVTRPVGQPADTFFGIMGGDERTAVIEMASAAGLTTRDLTHTSRTRR